MLTKVDLTPCIQAPSHLPLLFFLLWPLTAIQGSELFYPVPEPTAWTLFLYPLCFPSSWHIREGQHKFLSFNLSPSLSMSFSISWSFHFGQQVLQKCTCESLFLFPYTLLIQPHSEHFHDIPLTFYSHIGTKLCLVYKSAFLLCSSLAFLQFP